MFLCDECTDDESIRKSHGRCEGCGQTATCNDLPADRYRPKPTRPVSPVAPTSEGPKG